MTASGCKGCEILPQPIPTTGTLYLSPPLGHTATKLRQALAEIEASVAEPYPQILAIDMTAGGSRFLQLDLSATFSQAELDDTKSLIVAVGVEPTVADLVQMRSLRSLLSRSSGAWLIDMIQKRRLLTHFQPIVHSINPEQVYAYECLVRGVDADGKMIYPGQLYDAARTGGVLFHLDRGVRLTHIASAIRENLQENIFINFNPTAIYDPAFCLQTTVKAIEKSGIPPERFVFEVVESDEIQDPERLPAILNFYRDAGFRVALDDLGAGYSSLNLLTKLKPDVIKLDMQLVRDVDRDPYKAQIALKLLELAQSLDILTVAEGIETVGEWQWCTEHGANFLQGYLFAKPAAVPPLRQASPTDTCEPMVEPIATC